MRSPGVYFESTLDKVADKDVFVAKIIPSRGAWFEFEVDKKRHGCQSVSTAAQAAGHGSASTALGLTNGRDP